MKLFDKENKYEFFVGNFYTKNKQEMIDTFNKLNIGYRIGQQAYDIYGKEIDPSYCLPLYIYKDSYNKYEKFQMEKIL